MAKGLCRCDQVQGHALGGYPDTYVGRRIGLSEGDVVAETEVTAVPGLEREFEPRNDGGLLGSRRQGANYLSQPLEATQPLQHLYFHAERTIFRLLTSRL